MNGINKVILVGNLGRDAELRHTPNGTPVSTLNLATTDGRFKNKEGKPVTEWHKVVVWGKTAESLQDYLLKGRQVYVEGRLQTRSWNDRDGNKRYTTEVVCEYLLLIGGRGDSPGMGRQSESLEPGDAAAEPIEVAEDDIPF